MTQKSAVQSLCRYFVDSREQFRLAGRLAVVTKDEPDAKLQRVRGLLQGLVGAAAISTPHQTFTLACCTPL